MPWVDQREIEEMLHVEKIKMEIVAAKGVLPPKENIEALGFMTNYYVNMTGRAGKAKAMRDQMMAHYLQRDDIAIGRAEALAKGSPFGMMKSYYEKACEGYLAIVNTLKKVHEYHADVAMGKY